MFGSDDIIRYGQKVRIESNPYLFKKPLFLSSMPLRPNCHSPVSRLQEASMHSKISFYGSWIIDSVDPNFRFEMQGEPVKANEPVLIRHASTSHYLAADSVKMNTDFGTEFEVMVNSFATKNKSQNLALEKNGQLTSDVPSKFQEPQNLFYFETATDPSYDIPVEKLNSYSIEDLVNDIRNKVLERSSNGIRGIARIFKAMDDNGNHLLDVDDFRWGLIDYGITITKEQATMVLDHFDRDKNGQVDFNEFLRVIRVPIIVIIYIG